MGLCLVNRRIPNLQCCIIELTLACNLKCIHCGSYAGKAREDELSADEIYKLIDDLKKIKCKQITLMGGEFIFRKDWLKIAKYINKKDIELVIISNGFALTDKIVKQFRDLKLYSVALSLDGTKEIHDKIRGVKGSFNKVIESIKKIQNNKISLGIITTISKLNAKELPKIRELLYKYGKDIRWQIQTAAYGTKLTKKLLIDEKDFIYICQFIEKSHLEKRYDPDNLLILGADDIGYNQKCVSPYISADYDWHGCKAGINVLGVQSNGNVKGCLSLPDKFIEANIREKSIVDIWNDKKSFKYSRHFTESDLGENCKECAFRMKCKGGCTDISYNRTGKIHNNPFCLHKIEKKHQLT